MKFTDKFALVPIERYNQLLNQLNEKNKKLLPNQKGGGKSENSSTTPLKENGVKHNIVNVQNSKKNIEEIVPTIDPLNPKQNSKIKGLLKSRKRKKDPIIIKI